MHAPNKKTKRVIMFSFNSTNAFAIDLGTSNTLVYQPKKGIILDEATSIAYDKNRRIFFDFGTSAHKMTGKSPKHTEVMHPLSKGAIANLEVAKAYIKWLIRRISNNSWLKPNILVSVPNYLNQMERNAVIEAGKEGGAREVLLIKDPFAAALGSSEAIEKPEGVLILDIGAGITEISLLSLNGIVMSQSLRIAGNDIDEAIIEYFKNNKRILIPLQTVEILKKELGDLLDDRIRTKHVNIKNLITRMPESYEISSLDVKLAILPIADKIVALAHGMTSTLPPSFTHDIFDSGILMTGGTSMLGGLDGYLSKHLKIDVNVAKNPLQNIILGAGRALEDKRYFDLVGKET